MGVLIASVIILSWVSHLVYLLLYQPVNISDIWFWLHILLQTWLSTGLFITAHDAMHRTVSSNISLNKSIGYLSTFLFAGMFYHKLNAKHQLHHQFPGTSDDPDYKTGNQNFFFWWFSFMKQYITIWQMTIMAVIFNILLLLFNELQLLTFWVLPSILATFQLFYFGTFRPHRLPHTVGMQPHNSRTLKRNHLWALVSCYFFGYHSEHHSSPQTPWWKLYELKNERIHPTNIKSEKI